MKQNLKMLWRAWKLTGPSGRTRNPYFKALSAWYTIGIIWTERACEKHGSDHYANGYPWLIRKLGWD